MAGVQRYARVLRAPDVARLMSAAVLARVPIGIDSLAMVLFVRNETGSFATAGLVVAGFGIGAGLCAPLMGRLIDAVGHSRVMMPLAFMHAVALGALAALGLAGAPAATLVACGLVVGLSIPPVGSVVRPMLPRLLAREEDLLPTAYALDGIAIETVFVTGPLLTALIVTLASPEVALLVAGAFAIGGTLLLVTTPASRDFAPDPARERHLLGALASPGVRTLVAISAPLGVSVGATEVTMTAFAADHGSKAAAGALLAAWAAGSGIGGLVYGAREHSLAPAARWVRFAVAFPLCCVPLLVAPSIAGMAFIAPLAGVCLAPLLAAQNQILGDVAPPGAVTEAFAWPITTIAIGAALGSAVAGALVQGSGWRPGFATAVAAAALAATMAVARRRTVSVLAPA